MDSAWIDVSLSPELPMVDISNVDDGSAYETPNAMERSDHVPLTALLTPVELRRLFGVCRTKVISHGRCSC